MIDKNEIEKSRPLLRFLHLIPPFFPLFDFQIIVPPPSYTFFEKFIAHTPSEKGRIETVRKHWVMCNLKKISTIYNYNNNII